MNQPDGGPLELGAHQLELGRRRRLRLLEAGARLEELLLRGLARARRLPRLVDRELQSRRRHRLALRAGRRLGSQLLGPLRLALRQRPRHGVVRLEARAALGLAQLLLKAADGCVLVLQRAELLVVLLEPSLQRLLLAGHLREATQLRRRLAHDGRRLGSLVERAVEVDEGGLRCFPPPRQRVDFGLEGADHTADLARPLLGRERLELASDLHECLAPRL